MAIVIKKNKELIVADEKLQEFIDMGYTQIDEKGKVKVSHREFVEKPAGYVEKPVEKKPFKGHKK